MMKQRSESLLDFESPVVRRRQVLATTLLTTVFAGFYFIPGLRFHYGLYLISLTSAILHFLLYIFFNKLFPLENWLLATLSGANIVMIVSAIHLTGGVTSPFTFLLFCILVIEPAYGFKSNVSVIAAAAAYLITIGVEYFKIAPPLIISTDEIYSSPLFTLLIVSTVVSFILISGNIYKFMIKSAMDRLEREAEEKRLIETKLSELDAPSQMGIVAHRIVHDLRGPLTAVSGYLELIGLKMAGNRDAAQLQKIVCEEVSRVSKLVDSLARYGRPHKKEKAVLCPVEIIESVLSVLSFYPDVNKITVVRKFPPKSSLRVYANKDELQQAYFNIFKNAIEALLAKPEPPRTIQVDIKSSGPMAEISISDNGPGIAPDILPAIMRKPGSGKANGTGVGLLITKDIFEQNNGTIEIRNREDSGARVITKIPIHDTDVS